MGVNSCMMYVAPSFFLWYGKRGNGLVGKVQRVGRRRKASIGMEQLHDVSSPFMASTQGCSRGRKWVNGVHLQVGAKKRECGSGQLYSVCC